MNQALILQPAWDFFLHHFGGFLSSPGFILTAVMLGVYVPGIVFSIIDVFISKRLTLKECAAVYWRAMKWYSTLYIVAMPVFLLVPLPIKLTVPATAPGFFEFSKDMVLYFLLGDITSYFWHRIEHTNRWYARHVHYVHHFDKPPLSIWTAMVVHPVEGFSVFVFFHLYGIVFPIHPFTFFVAAFSLTAVTMITHCGYRIPVYDTLFANSPCHDFHHANRKPTNISVVLTICDRLFGTYQKA
ncbi:MAG TPA: sterol desaturase family protein [Pseudomonadales bacterium]|nr:sterol desaturase family protein [Pseudomonadales bacterium]